MSDILKLIKELGLEHPLRIEYNNKPTKIPVIEYDVIQRIKRIQKKLNYYDPWK